MTLSFSWFDIYYLTSYHLDRKKENRGVDAAAVDKATGEARLIIQTTTEVEIVNDGYRWRKYGQKLVKGNPNPRLYWFYNCYGLAKNILYNLACQSTTVLLGIHCLVIWVT